jgi:hypothetical protein
MATVSAGSFARVFCPLASDVTVTPGAQARVIVDDRDAGGAVIQIINAATTFAVSAGSSVQIEAINADANYDGDVQLLTPGGGVAALSEVITEVAATASAGATVLTGAGTYAGYRCTVAAGNITVYDNTAASGKVLVPTTALAVGSFPIYGAGHPGRVAVTTGVHVVLSGAATVQVGVEAA